ncbi:transposase [Photobacterium frigidiphilum]|uniref:transposase n=1 Tax=Photobacterium frigidiphilum TaxID=264736 RepID=UPI000D16600A
MKSLWKCKTYCQVTYRLDTWCQLAYASKMLSLRHFLPCLEIHEEGIYNYATCGLTSASIEAGMYP